MEIINEEDRLLHNRGYIEADKVRKISVQIRFKNRMSITTAMVIPTGEPLLGANPMEDMDVIVHPLTEELVVNPENPYIAKKKLK